MDLVHSVLNARHYGGQCPKQDVRQAEYSWPDYTMSYGVNGWHNGELAIQRKLGFDGPATALWHYIESTMDEYFSSYYRYQAPFVFVTTLDDDLRPWGSVLAGSNGTAGFIKSPNDQTLTIEARSWDGDPFIQTVTSLSDETREDQDRYRYLMAGLGIEFPNRMRHKFAGYVRGAKRKAGHDLVLDLAVDQSLGNCPKYISIRKFVPHPDTHPHVAHRELKLPTTGELPQDVIDFIQSADTMFLATVYRAPMNASKSFPSHAGINHRGGHPGFMRVRNDRRTIVIPDYSGNRHLSSLGNIETTGGAGITIISYTTGDILYLTGDAKNLVGDEAQNIMARQNALTTLAVTGYVLVRDALPVRESEGTLVPSPYSPPIKYLREEGRETSFSPGETLQARLKSIDIHADDIATFEFELAPHPSGDQSPPLSIRPGQAVALDFSGLLGRPAYAHMAPMNPKSINDDRVRTWTVSSAHEGEGGARGFRITMRRKDGGVVTGALFAIMHKLSAHKPELLQDATPLKLDIGVIGIAGEFCLPPREKEEEEEKLLFAAGGIGVTPFLSMIEALVARGPNTRADIVLALSTREPEVFLAMVRRSLGESPPPGIRVKLDVFTHADPPVDAKTDAGAGGGIVTSWHRGHIPTGYWKDVIEGREVFVCGPEAFGNVMVKVIREAGAPNERIHREGFDY